MQADGILQILLVVLLALCPATADTSNWMDQSWFFDWNPSNERFPVPTTAQCETIHITWSRQTATGPDPVSPYFLQIYTSNFFAPFIIETGSDPETYLTVPFAPGTQYEICMVDSFGHTGGCQAVYTVYPNTTTSTPSCTNLTLPAKSLNVLSEATQGTLSPYGWVPSCTDIRVTPKGGTPPFIFTVSPALHPPLNITSNDMSPINWTVDLSWGMPFFITLVDSTGLSWTNGVIHAGKGDTGCFANSASRPSVALTVGSAVAGLVVGAMAVLLAAFLISKRRKARRYSGDEKPVSIYKPYSPQTEGHPLEELRPGQSGSPTTSPRYERLPSLTGTSHEFHVEPFVPPSRAQQPQSHNNDDTSVRGGRTSWHDGSDGASQSPSRQEPGSQVYVIHHDSGRAPVSVVTSRGTQVVELPPGYSNNFVPPEATQSTSSSSTRRQEKSPAGPAGDLPE